MAKCQNGEKMSNIGTAYVQIEPTAKGISGKIEKEMGGEGRSAGESFSNGFGKVIGGIGKASIAAVGAAATAVGGIVSSAVSSFANYEQLVGGVETLFGDAAQTVIDNADAAFQTAGLSANDYMETVTSFSASLLQSLGGDTAAAAKTADMALIDMSDNANKMGSSMESIQNAYQGFAKQNYTMLDNLKLGYGGTKSEMERLLADAQKLTGVKYDLDNLNDVYNAIHAIQENLGITGTTAKEASTTIQGSLAAMKGAWENTLTAISQGDGWDMGVYINNLMDTVKTFAGNVMPIIQQSLVGVSELISSLAPEIATAIADLVPQILPGLLEAGVQVINALAQGILQAIPQLMPSMVEVANSLLNTFLELVPQFLSMGLDIISELAKGITEAIPTLIPTLTNVVIQIVTMLSDPGMLTSLIQTGIDLILALVDGLLEALPQLIEAAPTIITNLITGLTTALPMLIEGAIQLVQAIVQNLPTIIQALVEAAPQIIEALVTGLVQSAPLLLAAGPMLMVELIAGIVKMLPQLVVLGKQLIDNIIQGLASAYAKLTAEGPKMFKQLYDKMSSELKKFLETGRNIVKQIIDGIKNWANNLYNIGNELLTTLKNKFLEKVRQFADIGKQIVTGIKEGLANAWQDVVKWFTEKIDELKKKAKDVLKIGSPSKVFADEIGKMIPLGIAEGIEAGMDDLDGTVISMTAGLTGTADSSMAARTYQPVSSQNDAMYDLLATYLPLLLNKEVDVKFEGGLDRFFRAIQNEARKNYQLTGAAL